MSECTALFCSKITYLFIEKLKRVHVLRVKEIQINTENAFRRDHFGSGGNNESEYCKKTLFWVSLLSGNLYLNL